MELLDACPIDLDLLCMISPDLQAIAGFTDRIPVAVKTLSSSDRDVVKKFMEEAELMKKFSHPNIVSLLGKQQTNSKFNVRLSILHCM